VNPDPSSREAGGPRRNALVTGASTGIGRAFAERLARDQYDLVLVARSADRLEALAKRLREERGVGIRVLPADLTDPAGLALVEAELRERTPDLLVNNAGFGTVGRFAELDLAGEDREVRLNALALLRLTHAVLGRMIERGHGAVVNVSSLAGETAQPYTATYAATKAFVTSLTEALSVELAGTGVRVQALLPGFTRTEFQERAGVESSAIPALAWMEPEAVVDASLAGLEKGQVICVPGLGYRLVAPLPRLLPRSWVRRLMGASLERMIR
jgi:short-subunit dehydrogenase